MVLRLFKDKYWCGNFCPHESLFDFIIMPISPNRKIPSFFKSKITKTIAFAWFSYMLIKLLSSVQHFFWINWDIFSS
ncbi:4Fe-4S binding protein [Anoxybacter fermentans]|uniref:4Fe-4S binding protein n=1 Tax=Anoxybacter fermentans TaxID=1323375 RepID=UPI003AB13869